MPVKFEDVFDFGPKMNLIDYLTDDTSNPISDFLLPDDIWNKFEIDLSDWSAIDSILGDASKIADDLMCPLGGHPEIRNHDCMWAGHCASKEHPADEPRMSTGCIIPVPPPIMKPPVMEIKQENPKPSGQQSLLKSHVRVAAPAVLQTPPMSDDEEAKAKTSNILKLLHDAIDDYDLEADSDLSDYFKDKDFKDEEEDEDEEEEEEEETEIKIEEEDIKPSVSRPFHAAESDHSYHKGKQSAMQMATFGIETPSDSEEEIDVVNVNEKFQFNNKSVFSFPNNPSTKDRQQIQMRMATAISKKRISAQAQGIKTIMPVRKTPEASPVKRKPAETARGGKKSRQYRTPVNTPYKRRQYGNSSDSEPEPSEKRSLHNNMERQRRIDLRNAFEDLRVLVPEVSKKERAAKVVILREAAQYCDFLTNTSTKYSKHFDELKKKQEFLRRRVSQLRRNLAANR